MTNDTPTASKPLRIGFDATVLSYNKEGIGNYVAELINAVNNLASAKDIVPVLFVYVDYLQRAKLKFPQCELLALALPNKPFSGVKTARAIAQAAKLAKIDILVSTHSHLLPIFFKPCVYLVHDISPLTHPQYYNLSTGGLQQKLFNWLFRKGLNSAQKILVTSEFVGKEITEFAKAPVSKIEVIGAGAAGWLDLEIAAETSESILAKYDLIPNNYFLSIGTVSPRKNYEFLLKAYAEYLKTKLAEVSKDQALHLSKLVIVGKLGWDYAQFLELAQKLEKELQELVASAKLTQPVEGKFINYLGFVEDSTANVLTKHAIALVALAKYEGFGMPLLEASLIGKEIICSNIAPFQETFAKVAHFVDIGSLEDIISTLKAVENGARLNSPEIAGKLAKKYNWQRVAKKLISTMTT